MQDQPNVHANIDNVDQPNYRSSLQSDSDYLPNTDESDDELPFVASSSDYEFITPNCSARPMSMSPAHIEESLPLQNLHLVVRSPSVHIPEFYHREIPYLDHPKDGPNMFMDPHSNKCISQVHKDDGKIWGMMTTNSSESFNGILKSARGPPVTAMALTKLGIKHGIIFHRNIAWATIRKPTPDNFIQSTMRHIGLQVLLL
ncbi:hypothetical protein FXO38_00339 [Capsicum annuum]|nr:hypothetical protein FXO37_16035 [Capsicum annuum]KAF3684362.1 hypothetical protein FXO38_00339 [Capsicum annuum]